MKMFRKFVSIIVAATVLISSLTFTFAAGAAEVGSEADAAIASEPNLQTNPQNGVILHAFNWSYNTIKDNLPAIKEAGYSTVQTSPVQQPEDYSASTRVANEWWKPYQPVSHQIAQKSWFGTKADLTALCAEADKYGIKIICDIVANHVGNENKVESAVSKQVQTYQPNIYSATVSGSQYYHNVDGSVSDGNVRQCVQGHLSACPDLNTSNSTVQSNIIALLEECIDCGVDGFRFDGAKHIETPSDGAYASNFWPNVTDAAKNYYRSKTGDDLYMYGEILNNCGPSSRQYSHYTPYINVTDNRTGDAVTKAVYYKDAGNAAKANYVSGAGASNIVLWAESHDTYEGDAGSAGIANTANVSDEVIAKAWALVAARKDSTALFFARPASNMGQVSTDTTYKSAAVSEVNKFKNAFVGQSEFLGSSGSIAYVRRGTTGIVLSNVGGNEGATQNVSISDSGMTDGSYIDTVTGDAFTVSNGTLTGSIGSSGVAVVYQSTATPKATASKESGTFEGETMTVKLGLENAVSGTYALEDSAPVSFTGTPTIRIGSDYNYGDTITLNLTATDAAGQTKSYSYKYKKTEHDGSGVYVFFNPAKKTTWKGPFNAWIYDEDTDASTNTTYTNVAGLPGQEMQYDEVLGYYYVEVPTKSYKSVEDASGSSTVSDDPVNYDLSKSDKTKVIINGLLKSTGAEVKSSALSLSGTSHIYAETSGTSWTTTTLEPSAASVQATDVTKGSPAQTEEPATEAPTTEEPATEELTEEPTTAEPTDETPEIIASGTTGDCTWTLDDEGKLTISGNGAMGDYKTINSNNSTAPWGTNIKSLVIENGVTNIGSYAFYNCTGLTSVTIPGSVTDIGNWSFDNCTGLTKITIPDSVENIGAVAFSSCTGLTKVTIPDSVTNIGDSAFSSCTGLFRVTLGRSVTNIGAYAFSDCNCLTGIVFPESVKSIGIFAFSGCTGLTSVDIPDTITRVGAYAFQNCINLSNITISDKLLDIGSGAFYNTAWYNELPNGLIYIGKVAYGYKGTMPSDTSIVIQDGTLVITERAFSGYTGLTNVTIPDGVQTIGNNAFDCCDNLTSVTIPASVTKIKDYAFGYFYNPVYQKNNDFIIYGFSGSEAERYADDNGITFIDLDESTTAEPTEEPTTEEVTTEEPTTESQELKVTSTSNFFPENTQTVLKGNGDTYVTVRYVFENDYKVDSFQWDMSFDNSALELIDTNGFMPNVNNSYVSYNVEKNRVRAAASNALQPFAFYNGNTFVSATFKVLKTGEANINLDVLAFEETEEEEPTTVEPPTEEPTTAEPTEEPTYEPTTVEPTTAESTTAPHEYDGDGQRVYFRFPDESVWTHSGLKITARTGKANVYCYAYAIYGNSHKYSLGWKTRTTQCDAEAEGGAAITDATLFSFDLASQQDGIEEGADYGIIFSTAAAGWNQTCDLNLSTECIGDTVIVTPFNGQATRENAADANKVDHYAAWQYHTDPYGPKATISSLGALMPGYFPANQPHAQQLSNALKQYLTNPVNNPYFQYDNNMVLCEALQTSPEAVYAQYLADNEDIIAAGMEQFGPDGETEEKVPCPFYRYMGENDQGQMVEKKLATPAYVKTVLGLSDEPATAEPTEEPTHEPTTVEPTTVEPTTVEPTYEPTTEPAPVEGGYYIVGTMTGWAVSADYKLTANETADGEYIFKGLNLTAGSDQFKIGYSDDGETVTTWYPEGMGNNYGENGEITATNVYDVYFRPDGQGGENWFHEYFYVTVQGEPTQTDESDFTEIRTVEDLYMINYDLDGNFKLMNDIDLTEATAQGGDWNYGGRGWEPIGSNGTYSGSTPFTGTFDGNGFEIKGMQIKINSFPNDISDGYVGLFACNSGLIKNLSLTGSVNVSAKGAKYVGAIAGFNSGQILNCINLSTVTTGYGHYCGGITGYNCGVIKRCCEKGNVYASAGYNNCYAGGIAGYTTATIDECYNCGSVRTTAGKYFVYGGVSSMNGAIYGHYNYYNGYSSGISYGTNTIKNCYNTGTVSTTSDGGSNYIFAGGISAGSGSVRSCYNIGTSTRAISYGTATDCYYLTGSGTGTTGAKELTSAQMKLRALYVGFDFDNIWFIDQQSDYVYPQLINNSMTANTEPTTESTPVEGSYYIVGTMTGWAVSADYKLTANEGAEGEYMFTGLNLTAGRDQFKIGYSDDGETITSWYPDNADNYGASGEITANGTYDVYFKPNGQGGEDWFYNCIYVAEQGEPEPTTAEPTTVAPTTAEPTTEPTPADTYTVAGLSEAMFGTTWDALNTANDMTKGGDGVYSITYADVQPEDAIQLKVVKNHSWDETWGDKETGDNYTFNVVSACDVTVTFDPATETVNVTGDGVTQGTDFDVYSVIAVGNGEETYLNGANWDPCDPANAMTKVADGIWEFSMEDIYAFDNYNIKFAVNSVDAEGNPTSNPWAHNFGSEVEQLYPTGEELDAVYNGKNCIFEVEEDGSTVKLQLDLRNFDFKTEQGAKMTITVTAPEPEPTTVAPTTAEPTTAEPTTAPAPTGGSLTVNAKSNVIFGDTTNTFAEGTSRITVAYYINSSKLMVNDQWKLTWDPSVLKFCEEDGINKTDVYYEGELLSTTYHNTPIANQSVINGAKVGQGQFIGNISNFGTYYPMRNTSTGGSIGVLYCTFDVIGSGSTDVNLDFVELRTKDGQIVQYSHMVEGAPSFPYTAQAAVYDGNYDPYYIDGEQTTEEPTTTEPTTAPAPTDGSLTVNATSNLFTPDQATYYYNSTEGVPDTVTVTYYMDAVSPLKLQAVQFGITYDSEYLTFDPAKNGYYDEDEEKYNYDQMFPVANGTGDIQLRLDENIIKFATAKWDGLRLKKNGELIPVAIVTFDVVDGAKGVTDVDCKVASCALTNSKTEEDYIIYDVNGLHEEPYNFVTDNDPSKIYAVIEPTGSTPVTEEITEVDTTAEATTVAPTTAEPTTVAPTTAEPETQEPTTEPAPVVNDIYTVAGSSAAMFGTTWDARNTANDMTLGEGGVYSITYADVQPESAIQLKVVKNHSWDEAWGDKETGDNYTFNVVSACDVTVTFDPATETVNVTGDGVTQGTDFDIYSVIAVGNGEETYLNGANWDPCDPANAMTKVADGIWEFSMEDIYAFDNYHIRFVVNSVDDQGNPTSNPWAHNFGSEVEQPYPTGEELDAVYNGKNCIFEVEEDGSTVKLQLDLRNFDFKTEQGAKMTITVTAPEPEPTTVEPTTVAPTTVAPTTAEPDTQPSTYEWASTILLTNSLSWEQGYLYAWDEEGNSLSGEWPGTKITDIKINDFGEKVFVCNIPHNAIGVVVNDGIGMQTVDITDFAVEHYWMDGTMTDLGHYNVKPYGYDPTETTNPPETQEPTTEPEALNGPDENGFFYVDGEKQLAYRLCEYEGDWYFVAENNMIAMDQKRYLNASVVEGTEFKAGYYYFDTDGKLQNLNGPDENDYFYINNEKQKAYKLCEYKGDWYLVAENNKIARDQKRYLNASICEGTPFTEGYYYFNADGKYESMNGPKEDGYFYINDVKQTAYKLCQYEGNYYFVAEYNKYAVDQRRYLSAANLEGTGYSPGYYYFDSEGKMVVKNGPWSDGYFYNYNVQVKAYKVVEFEGNYYFVAENNKYVTSCTRNITDTMVGDTGIAPGKYEFGADGKMVYRQGPNADGYFYRANQKVMAYELCEYNGYYYLVAENNKYVKSTTRNVQAAWVKDTGVVPGRYEFDADGKMDYKQGPNADGYFYRANQKVMAYELCEYNGDYYLVAENNKYVKNATRNVQAAWVKDTGVVPDIYEFDADGKMNYRQGPNADGYFYRDNQKVKAYKLCEYNGDYYLVAENNKYVKSATRNLQAAWVKDTGIAPGTYEFDADGKMIIPS